MTTIVIAICIAVVICHALSLLSAERTGRIVTAMHAEVRAANEAHAKTSAEARALSEAYVIDRTAFEQRLTRLEIAENRRSLR